MPQRTSIALTRSMAHHPEVQHNVAEMRIALDAAEALLERTAPTGRPACEHADWPVRLVATRQFVDQPGASTSSTGRSTCPAAPASFKRNRLEQLFRDVRMGRFHPGNTLLAHELIGKLCLGHQPRRSPALGLRRRSDGRPIREAERSRCTSRSELHGSAGPDRGLAVALG